MLHNILSKFKRTLQKETLKCFKFQVDNLEPETLPESNEHNFDELVKSESTFDARSLSVHYAEQTWRLEHFSLHSKLQNITPFSLKSSIFTSLTDTRYKFSLSFHPIHEPENDDILNQQCSVYLHCVGNEIKNFLAQFSIGLISDSGEYFNVFGKTFLKVILNVN